MHVECMHVKCKRLGITDMAPCGCSGEAGRHSALIVVMVMVGLLHASYPHNRDIWLKERLDGADVPHSTLVPANAAPHVARKKGSFLLPLFTLWTPPGEKSRNSFCPLRKIC